MHILLSVLVSSIIRAVFSGRILSEHTSFMKVAWNINLNNVRAGTQIIISICELLIADLVINNYSLTNETSTPHYPHTPCRKCFEHPEYVIILTFSCSRPYPTGTLLLYQQHIEIHNKANRLSLLFIYPIRHLLFYQKHTALNLYISRSHRSLRTTVLSRSTNPLPQQ